MSDENLDNLLENINPNESQQKEPTALTPEQEAKVFEIWNNSKTPPSIKELTQAVFGGVHDGRSKCSKLIRELLAKKNLQATVSYQYQKKGEINLTDDQKEFIANNINKMTCLEIAEALFNKKLTNLSNETRAVIAFARTLNDRVKYSDPIDIATDKYKAPQQESSMIDRINKYVDNPIDRSKYGSNDRQKRWVKALISYVNSYRFIQTINSYDSIEDRELFESSFISYTYGVDDLTAEERDQYIMLCSEVVNGKHINARIVKYERIADESVDGTEDGKKLTLTFVEAISNLRKEHNDCIKRQQSLINDLNGKRSSRVKDRIRETESLISLVEFWRNEETRKRLINSADIKRKELQGEITRLENMDTLKFEIFGCDPNEILNS